MVSKDITVESIEEVSKILRRAPVIWDNIHANDYDQKRLFLGPYKGRSTELIPRLKGVLTNPNCEFESNFVAIHTLATWYKSNMNGVRKDVVMSKQQRLSFVCLVILQISKHTTDRKDPAWNEWVKCTSLSNKEGGEKWRSVSNNFIKTLYAFEAKG